MEIKNVSFFYKEKQVLHDVTFSLPNPSVFGLIGPNGAGKTTLFSILSGILQPASGELLGIQKPGLLLQNTSLYEEATGRQNLEIFSQVCGPSSNQVNYALDVVEIDSSTSGRKFKTYSQGLKQRILIARAFLSSSTLILLDEPFNAVDIPTMLILKKSIRDIVSAGEKTVVVSSHHLKEIEDLITDGVMLNKGRVIHQFTDFGKPNRVSVLTFHSGDDLSSLCNYLSTNQYEFTAYQNQIRIIRPVGSSIWPFIRFCEDNGLQFKKFECGESLENLFITYLDADNGKTND